MTTYAAPSGVTELVEVGQHVCLPGEPVLLLQDNAVLMVGSGIARAGQRRVDDVDGEVLVATVCGPVVKEKGQPGQPWVYRIASAGRYVPKRGEPVVATVVRALPMSYQVMFGGAHPAVLDALAFDGATKASRPRLRVGDHLYCHVANAALDADVVVSCCATGGMEAKEWTTGESVFGPLNGGCVVRVSPLYARTLMQQPACLLLSLLGERTPFEIAVGANGWVWLKGVAADSKLEQTRTVAIAACITESEQDASSADIQMRVDTYFPPLSNSGTGDANNNFKDE